MDQDLDASRYEVIVVDNASSDDTAAIAEARGARVVTSRSPTAPARATRASRPRRRT